MLLCCLRCTLKPSASAISLFRSCSSTSGSATSPTAYRILCLRLAHLVHHAFQHDSAMGPRLDTGGWLTLTKTHYCTSSRQGLPPCKICRALPGAITSKLSGASFSVRLSFLLFVLREPGFHMSAKYLYILVFYTAAIDTTSFRTYSNFVPSLFHSLDNALRAGKRT